MNNKCQVDLLSALQILALPLSTARLPFTLRWGGRDKENIVQRSWFEILLPYIAPWSTSESQSVRARADWVSYQPTSTLDRFGARPEAGTCSGIMKLVSDTAGTSIQVAWLSCHVMEIDPVKIDPWKDFEPAACHREITRRQPGTAMGCPDSGPWVPVSGPVSATCQLGGPTEPQFPHLKKTEDGPDTETLPCRITVRI